MTFESVDGLAEILLVEDDPFDAELAMSAISKVWINYIIHLVTDGEEAIAFLRKCPGYEDKPVPDLVLLDVNLPQKSGCEVLRELKTDPEFMHIPTVMLSAEPDTGAALEFCRLHADAVISKPASAADLRAVKDLVAQYWLSNAKQRQSG